MERLTIRNSDGSVSQPTSTTVEAAFYRLAEYEDTGVTPEQVRNCLEFEDIAMDALIPFDRLRELAQADREGRVEIQKFTPGQRIWVVVRDWREEDPEIFGLMFLASKGSYVFASPYMYNIEEFEETMDCHAGETEECDHADIGVYRYSCCFGSREEAEKAMEAMQK